MNFARDVVDAAEGDALALVELARDGRRREWLFGEVSEGAARLAGWMRARGVGRGDVVMTLVGNRPEWVMAMVACFRLGAVVLPCTEQLRPKDLAQRVGVASPVLVLADPRNRATLERAALGCPVAYLDEPGLFDGPDVAEAVSLGPLDPCLLTFTSGTAGTPKAVLHGQRYLAGQAVQAEHWLAPARGELVWCTAASGWSKSAR
ncbi:MAG: AMP-binding protein, partial [Actinomycetota bacterium]|nr:AMP-binding protein [Actinomycetota bacterium]